MRDETKRTEVDDVTLEVILELLRIKLDRANVPSVMVIVDVNGDAGCPVNEADGSARNIIPLSTDLLEERLELAVVLVHLLQLIFLNLQGILVLLPLLLVLALRLRLQSHNFFSQADGLSDVLGDQGSGLVKEALESMESADLNVLARCASTLEPVVHGRIRAEDVLVADGEDPDARLAILALVLVEEEGDGTLGIRFLPAVRSDRHSQRGCERATDEVGWVGFVGDAHKGWTRQLLHGALVSFDNSTIDFMVLENMENVGRSVTDVLDAGSVGMRGNPDYNGA